MRSEAAHAAAVADMALTTDKAALMMKESVHPINQGVGRKRSQRRYRLDWARQDGKRTVYAGLFWGVLAR